MLEKVYFYKSMKRYWYILFIELSNVLILIHCIAHPGAKQPFVRYLVENGITMRNKIRIEHVFVQPIVLEQSQRNARLLVREETYIYIYI